MAIYLIDFENVHDDGLEGIKGLSQDDKVIIFYGIKIKSISFERHVDIMSSKAHVEYVKTNKVAKNYLDFQLATYLGYVIGKGEKGPVYIVSKDTGYDSIVDYWKSHSIKIDRRNNIQGESGTPNQASAAKQTPNQASTPKQASTAKQGAKPAGQQPVRHAPKLAIKTTGQNAGQNAGISQTKAPAKANTENLSEAYRKKVRQAIKEDKLSASSYTIIYKAILSSKEKQDFNRELVKSFGQEKGNLIYNKVKDIMIEYHSRARV